MEDVGAPFAFEFNEIRKTRSKKIYEKYEHAIEESIEFSGIQKKTLCIEKGDLLIWSANLLHGGDPMIETGSTRFS